MANIEERVEQLIQKPILDLGYELYDVQYIKEGQNYFLRVFIEKPEGEIDLNDCETVSNGINDILDTAEYIKEQYFLEVSSTGVEKILRKDKHLQAHIGELIEIKLFKPIVCIQKDKKGKEKEIKQRELVGILQGFNEKEICIVVENEEVKVDRKDVSHIKTVFDWDHIS